jgi:hypothetical protein
MASDLELLIKRIETLESQVMKLTMQIGEDLTPTTGYAKIDQSSNGYGTVTDSDTFVSAAMRFAKEQGDVSGKCPVHRYDWKYREGGISAKTGKAYDGFWSCGGKNPDGSYCKNKPSIGWVNSQR